MAGHLALAATFAEGQAFQFGSQDFIANKIGKLHLRDSASSQSTETSSSSSLRSMLELTSLAAIPDDVIKQGSQLMGLIDSLLPNLDSVSDGYKSSGGLHGQFS